MRKALCSLVFFIAIIATAQANMASTTTIELDESGEPETAVDNSMELTTIALLYIDQKQYTLAKEILENALSVNPEDELAVHLYQSISHHDPAAVPQEQPVDVTEEPDKTAAIAVSNENEPSESTETPDIPNAAEETVVVKEKKSIGPIPFGFSLGPLITFATSNALPSGSRATLLGLMADAWVFLPFWDTRIGFQGRYYQGRYTGDFNTTSSGSGTNIATQRFIGSVLIRTWLFDNGKYRTTLGGSLSYNWFSDKNEESELAFPIRKFSGPGFGFFIEDPIIARFADGSFSRNLSFKLSNEIYFSSDSGELLTGLDLDFGALYRFGIMGMAVGYNLYTQFLGGITETHNSIYIKTIAEF